MKSEPPKELHSERLLLRLPCKTDFALMREYIEHPLMRKYSFFRYGDPDLYPQIYLGTAAKDWKAGTAYRMSIVLKDTNTMIGHMMLYDVNKTHRTGELGYWMAREHWGNGYTKEAAQVALEFGFKRLRLRRIYALTIDGNDVSAALLMKLGFKHESTARKHEKIRGRYYDVHCFGLMATEYRVQSISK